MDTRFHQQNNLEMNALTNYPNFKNDIQEIFGELMSKNGLHFETIHDGCYLLCNSKIVLKFTYDRGEVSCNIKHPEDRNEVAGYNVYSICRYLYPKSKLHENDKEWISPQEQLVIYLDILSSSLEFILVGDFSWEKGYLEDQQNLNKFIKFVWQNIDPNSLIYKKFAQGDLSWIDDLRQYLQDNNISLPSSL